MKGRAVRLASLRPKPGRLRFGLRTLFVLLLIAGIGLGWLCRMSPHWHAIAELRALGFDVEVAHPADSKSSQLMRRWLTGTTARVSSTGIQYLNQEASSRARKAIGQLLGLEAFDGRHSSQVLVRDLAPGLALQTRLRELAIHVAAWTDAAVFVGNFPDLRALVVDDPPFSKSKWPMAIAVPEVRFDCVCLEGNRRLESLELHNLLVVNCDRLSELAELKRLRLDHVDQNDLDFATRISGLKEFSLSCSEDSFDVSAIPTLRSLERFGFGGHGLNSLGLFRDLPELRRLTLFGPANDLAELARHKSLEDLSLNGAGGYQCSPGELPGNLVRLQLKPEMGSVDASIFSGLNRLKILSLRNAVRLQSMAGLPLLEELELEETVVESADSFTGLPGVKRIFLHQCRIAPEIVAEIRRARPEIDLTLTNCRTPDGTWIGR